jgi:peptidoglycan/LPS O-acetylase OafA/YrhL
MPASDAGYRPDVDGLRGIAIAAVIGFHAFPTQVPGGFIGVDVFFVISGYLISRIIFGGLADGTFSFASFYTRRIKRLFPALLVVLAVVWLAGWFALIPSDFQNLGKEIAAGATYLSNVLFWSETGYFDKAAAEKPLLHLWSLGVEEQFYLLFPFIIFVAWLKRINLLAIIVLIGVPSFVTNVMLVAHHYSAAAFYLLTRASGSS